MPIFEKIDIKTHEIVGNFIRAKPTKRVITNDEIIC
jgi:hypothetical protein